MPNQLNRFAKATETLEAAWARAEGRPQAFDLGEAYEEVDSIAQTVGLLIGAADTDADTPRTEIWLVGFEAGVASFVRMVDEAV